jgi:hypothetical protein
MAPMSDADDIEMAFYEKFFFSRDMEPYPVQEQAFAHIFAGDGVLVTVPTGTGKTLMAKAAMFKALSMGQTAVYTTPLRALTEEKYRELCADFGDENVGFATGDFQENRTAPIQVEVAEILWNRVYSNRGQAPADVVVLDEGHYFNEPQRGYVWEQTIIGLHPSSQLVILSATVGHADQFCHWVELTRRTPLKLVESRERTVPLAHEYREDYLIEVVRELAASGDVPVIIFTFGRERCFDNARLLKSCRRFTTDEERARIDELMADVFHEEGVADELRPLLLHGIGIHHAGVLPRYKQLVEELTLERLLKFVVSTETISAGINLPAKVVIFPELRKFIQRKARLLTAAEYHQMAGRAGRPQFDDKGVAITLAPESVVQEMRKEIKTAKKQGYKVDEEQVRKACYARARSDAERRSDVVWHKPAHHALVTGEPAALTSKTHITAEMVLAIGLPDLAVETLPGEEVDLADAESRPAYSNLNIRTVVDHLLLPERERRDAHRLLAHVTDNLRALDVVDEHGAQIAGERWVVRLLRVEAAGLLVRAVSRARRVLGRSQRDPAGARPQGERQEARLDPGQASRDAHGELAGVVGRRRGRVRKGVSARAVADGAAASAIRRGDPASGAARRQTPKAHLGSHRRRADGVLRVRRQTPPRPRRGQPVFVSHAGVARCHDDSPGDRHRAARYPRHARARGPCGRRPAAGQEAVGHRSVLLGRGILSPRQVAARGRAAGRPRLAFSKQHSNPRYSH